MYPRSWIEPFLQLPRFFRFVKECLKAFAIVIFCLIPPMAVMFGLAALATAEQDKHKTYVLVGFPIGCLLIGGVGVGMFLLARRLFQGWFDDTPSPD